MTMFGSSGSARTMDFHANDVGYVPAVAGHYVENTGNEDLVFLGMFKSSYYSDVSLNQWIRRLPPLITKEHLRLDSSELAMIPRDYSGVIAK